MAYNFTFPEFNPVQGLIPGSNTELVTLKTASWGATVTGLAAGTSATLTIASGTIISGITIEQIYFFPFLTDSTGAAKSFTAFKFSFRPSSGNGISDTVPGMETNGLTGIELYGSQNFPVDMDVKVIIPARAALIADVTVYGTIALNDQLSGRLVITYM